MPDARSAFGFSFSVKPRLHKGRVAHSLRLDLRISKTRKTALINDINSGPIFFNNMTWQGARKGVQINSKGRDSPDEQQAITPGKLADESKLGGLNQLMYTSFSIAKPYSIPLKKRFREGWTENENSTSQTTPKEVIQDEPQNGKTEICENNNNINMRDKSRKRSKRTLQEDLDERTCKGKRYMEFTGPKQNGPNLNKNKTPPKKKLSKVQILKMNLSSKYFNTSPLKKEPNKTAKDKISQDHNLNLLADLAETALQKNKADD